MAEPQGTARLRSGLWWFALAGALMNVLRGFHWNPGGTLWIDPYWVGFGLTSYPEGFRRRALMGTVYRALFPGGVSIIFLNVAGLVVLTGCVFLMFWALCRLARVDDWRRKLFVFALAASSATAVFYETMGDLLHVDLLMFCGAALLCARYVRSELVRLVVLSVCVVVGFLTHEASLFLFVPVLPFLVKRRPVLKDFVLPALFYVGLLGLSHYWADAAFFAHPAFHANLYPHGVQMASTNSTPSFANELSVVRRVYFGTHDARIYFVGRVLRIVVLVICYLTALVAILPRQTFQRVFSMLGWILFCSVPLWIVAVDWARFLTYAMMLALVAAAIWGEGGSRGERVAEFLTGEWMQVGAVYVLLTSSNFPAVHVDCMTLQDAQIYCVVLAVGAVMWMVKRRGGVART